MYTHNHFLNHYGILDFQQIVGIDEVKKAYRILAKRYHPDVNPTVEAQEKMKAINAAYEILSNPQHKALYDEQYREYFSGFQREKEFTLHYQKTKTQKATKADNFYRVFAWIIIIVIFRLIAAADKQSYSNRNNNSYTYTSKKMKEAASISRLQHLTTLVNRAWVMADSLNNISFLQRGKAKCDSLPFPK